MDTGGGGDREGILVGQYCAGSQAQCRWLGKELVYFIITTVRVMLPPAHPPHCRENTFLNLLVFKLPGIHGQRGLFKLQTEPILNQRHR